MYVHLIFIFQSLLTFSLQSVTPLEQALATRTLHYSSLSSPQHLITALAMYIHHHDDPAVPVDAIKLLARLATVRMNG